MIELQPRGSAQDPDGVRVVQHASSGARRTQLYQGLALLFAAGCIGYVVAPRKVAPPPSRDPVTNRMGNYEEEMRKAGPAEDAAARDANKEPVAGSLPAAAGVASSSPPVSHRSLTPRRTATHEPDKNPEQTEAEAEDLAQRKAMAAAGIKTSSDLIQALHDNGIYTGIGAFNPPGTSPPLEGLVVPDDYELPEGFVRHYQTTDDGQSIPPILMFNPDYDWSDANGNPVSIPDNLVVPPEYAPPGMPLHNVEIPKPREPGNLGR